MGGCCSLYTDNDTKLGYVNTSVTAQADFSSGYRAADSLNLGAGQYGWNRQICSRLMGGGCRRVLDFVRVFYKGTVLLAGQVGGLVALVICFGGFWVKLRQEEALLTKHLPGYAEYMRHTKALVPFIL